LFHSSDILEISSLLVKLGFSFFKVSLRLFWKKKKAEIPLLGAFLSFLERFVFFSSKNCFD